MDLNKAMIIGRLTRDPEVRTTPNGANVTSFGVATSMVWKDQAGVKQEKPEYHNIIAWRKLGDICGQYLKKGMKVYVEGRIQTRNWDDQNGVKHYRTEIIADNMIMLESKNASYGNNAPQSVPQEPAPANSSNEQEINIEEIPF